MAQYRVRETFFRPDAPVVREASALPADIHNGLCGLVTRAAGGCVFLPIRSMQYLAVVDREETVFVDAVGGYAHQDGEGGRLIRIAWQPRASGRESLSDPVPCDIVHYYAGLKETQWRLIGEIRSALRLAAGREIKTQTKPTERRVLAFRRPGPA